MVNKIKKGIVFIKTTKCGSSTVSKWLEELTHFPLFKLKTTNDGEFPSEGFVNLNHLQWRHINEELVKVQNRAIISCIRNPLDRLKSHFRHHRDLDNRYVRYGSDFGTWYIDNHLNTNLEKGFNGLDNYISKYLGIKKVHDIEKYDFIFVTEHMEKSKKLFEEKTGVTLSNLYENKGISDDELLITDEQYNIFKQNNKLDYQVYQYILDKYGF